MGRVTDARFAQAVAQFRGLLNATKARFAHLRWLDGELEQAALIGLWEALAKLDQDADPIQQRNYIIGFVRARIWWDAVDLGLIVDHKHGHRRQRTLLDFTLDEPDPETGLQRKDLLAEPADLEESVVAIALLRGLKEALLDPPSHGGRPRDLRWQALGLHVVGGLDIAAIAAVIGRSKPATQALLYRAKRDARSFVQERWF